MPGPFLQYVEPGVYTRTLTDNTLATLTGDIRIPLFVGVGDEDLSVTDFEIVRGSSAQVDNLKTNEDVSSQLDGLNREFFVSKYPIVTGEGLGIASFDPKNVEVSVNGLPAGVAQLFGDTGKVVLSSIPKEDDVVKITYYFKRTDTKIDNDNLSVQADGSNKEFKTNYVPIVDGSNGGIATTDISKVTVTVNDVVVDLSEVHGQLGIVVLEDAPLATDVVKVSYWTNTWQDTYDYLPVNNINEVIRVGTAPGRNDFTNTLDFVIEDNKIQWGNSFSTKPVEVYPTSEPFDDQINSYLWDNRVYMRLAEGDVDGSNKTFTLEYLPTEGTGKGSPTDDINLISVYVGTSVSDALSNGQVSVESLIGAERSLDLKDAPSVGENVYVTYYHNMISDDTFELKCTIPSTPTTEGVYTIDSFNNGSVLAIEEDKPSHFVSDPNFAIEGITFPIGGFDGQTIPGFSVEETILLNFINSSDYLVLSSIGAEGSNGSGTLGQTYIDEKTGVRFTVMAGTTVTYQAGDILEFDISSQFKTALVPQYSIPGLKTTITNLTSVAASNTAEVSTYNKSGAEPNVGDFYYFSASYAKTEYPIKVYTKIKDIEAAIGTINTSNRLSLAAQLAMSNGAIAVALAQVLRNNSGIDANLNAYKEIFKLMESPIKDTNIRPSIICPVTTNQEVINELRLHCEKVSSIRYRSERTGIYGYAVGTTPEQAQAFARNMKSKRLMGLYPDGAIIGLVDEIGNINEAVVDGSFLAAAMTGLAVNPQYDPATPLTHKTLTGFRRLVRQVDAVTMNQTAIAGLTILEDLAPNFLVRHAMTTDPTNVLTREPTVTFIGDYVQKQVRNVLDPFIGIKFLPKVRQEVQETIDNLLNQLIDQEIITAYQGTTVEQDENDPTIMRVSSYYSPVFPVNWIVVTLNVRVRL